LEPRAKRWALNQRLQRNVDHSRRASGCRLRFGTALDGCGLGRAEVGQAVIVRLCLLQEAAPGWIVLLGLPHDLHHHPLVIGVLCLKAPQPETVPIPLPCGDGELPLREFGFPLACQCGGGEQDLLCCRPLYWSVVHNVALPPSAIASATLKACSMNGAHS